MKTNDINMLAEEYISTIRTLFPLIGKEEDAYLTWLHSSVVEYIECSSLSTLDDLYTRFGTPQEAVDYYYSSMRTEDFRKFGLKKRLIRFLFVLAAVVVVIAVISIIVRYYQQNLIHAQEALLTHIQ